MIKHQGVTLIIVCFLCFMLLLKDVTFQVSVLMVGPASYWCDYYGFFPSILEFKPKLTPSSLSSLALLSFYYTTEKQLIQGLPSNFSVLGQKLEN